MRASESARIMQSSTYISRSIPYFINMHGSIFEGWNIDQENIALDCHSNCETPDSDRTSFVKFEDI